MFDFEDTAPTRGAAAPNPFTDIIKSIAGRKTDGGAPVAKAFWLPCDDPKSYNRTLRLLTEAGPLNNVTVYKDPSDPVEPYRENKNEETGEITVISSGEYTKVNGEKSINKTGKPARLISFWTSDIGAIVKRNTKKDTQTDTPAKTVPAKATPAKKAVPPVADFKAPTK